MDNMMTPLCPTSRLGFGAWAIGGPYEFGWGPVDDAQSLEAIVAAHEHGINWIDTAPAYGCGHSEEVVGRALMAIGRSMRVFTKCGRTWDSAGKVSSDLRPDSIRLQWEQSIARLGVDAIDLYQIHRPDTVTGTPLGRSWQELIKLRDEGKVRALGLCNVTLEQFQECAAVGRVDALQTPVNVLRAGDVELRLAAQRHGALVLAYSPMESGLLSGAFDRARIDSLPAGDWRAKSSKFASDSLAHAEMIVQALRQLSGQTGYSISALAIAWAIRQPGVSAAIVGVRRLNQIADWSNAPSINLDAQKWEPIDRLAHP